MSVESMSVNKPEGSMAGRMAVAHPTLRSTKLGRDSTRERTLSRYNKEGSYTSTAHVSRGRDDRSISYRSSDIYYPTTYRGPVQYENTYKTEPEAKFSPAAVGRIIHDVLEENLKDLTYDAPLMGTKAKQLSEIIKERAKAQKLDRFKLVSWVTICDKNMNNIRIASRGVWDDNCDGFANAVYENLSLSAIGMVYAIYQE